VTETNHLIKNSLILSFIEKMREHGSWCGETHIQKAMYFLQHLAGIPLEFQFILYKHGPFSFDFRDELTAMFGDGLLEYEARPFPYGPSLRPTELGRKIMDYYLDTVTPYSTQIEFIANFLGKKSVVELERMGTALYVTLLEKTPNPDPQLRAQKITQLKPHVPFDDALSAVHEVDGMRVAYEQIPR
jgi:hypothetical protein